jgi:hypothetical protein
MNEEIEGSVFSKKWSNLKSNAKKKKSTIRKEILKTGGGLNPPIALDFIDEQVLAASQSNYDLPSNTDCEPHNQIVNRKYIKTYF